MTGWFIALIIVFFFLLLGVIPIGAVVRLEDGKTDVWVRAGFLKFKRGGKKKPAKPGREKRRRKPDEKRAVAAKKYVQSLDDVIELAKIAKKTLKRAIRIIRVNRLHLTVSVASDDAAKTALTYGRLNMLAASLLPLLHEYLNIHGDRIRLSPDFERDKPTVFLYLDVTTTVNKAFWFAARTLWAFLKYTGARAKSQTAAKAETQII
ncbi:MAG: DUF2953 domain-containing protein [Oscillospiraceae bacterium]|jgi:hypothetical protein|nr:DUF2953 domain-containing protein [Oscillospiraceae bacterium]